jgi:hypothetical protein
VTRLGAVSFYELDVPLGALVQTATPERSLCRTQEQK